MINWSVLRPMIGLLLKALCSWKLLVNYIYLDFSQLSFQKGENEVENVSLPERGRRRHRKKNVSNNKEAATTYKLKVQIKRTGQSSWSVWQTCLADLSRRSI